MAFGVTWSIVVVDVVIAATLWETGPAATASVPGRCGALVPDPPRVLLHFEPRLLLLNDGRSDTTKLRWRRPWLIRRQRQVLVSLAVLDLSAAHDIASSSLART